MTPATFREARQTLGLTQSALADLLGVDARTVRKWEGGERAIPTLVERVMGWLVGGFRPPEWRE